MVALLRIAVLSPLYPDPNRTLPIVRPVQPSLTRFIVHFCAEFVRLRKFYRASLHLEAHQMARLMHLVAAVLAILTVSAAGAPQTTLPGPGASYAVINAATGWRFDLGYSNTSTYRLVRSKYEC